MLSLIKLKSLLKYTPVLLISLLLFISVNASEQNSIINSFANYNNSASESDFDKIYKINILRDKLSTDLQLQFYLEKSSEVEILLLDNNGKIAETFEEIHCSPGKNKIRISSFLSGNFNLQIIIDKNIISKQITLL